MQLFIRFLTKTFCINVDLSCTIQEIKVLLENKEGIKPCQQRLVCSGTESKELIDNNKTLKDYKVEKDSTIWLIPKMKGC